MSLFSLVDDTHWSAPQISRMTPALGSFQLSKEQARRSIAALAQGQWKVQSLVSDFETFVVREGKWNLTVTMDLVRSLQTLQVSIDRDSKTMQASTTTPLQEELCQQSLSGLPRTRGGERLARQEASSNPMTRILETRRLQTRLSTRPRERWRGQEVRSSMPVALWRSSPHTRG